MIMRRLPLFAFVALLSGALSACPCQQETDPGVDAGGSKLGKGSGRPKVSVLRETEPNDSPTRANDFVLESTAPGSPVFKPIHGTLQSAKDVDWFVIPAQDVGMLRTLKLLPKGKVGDLEFVWHTDDKNLPMDLKGAGKGEVIMGLRSGVEVKLGVRASVGPFPLAYSLELASSPQSPTALLPEPEPADAALVAPGRIQGLFNYQGDVDRVAIRIDDNRTPTQALRLEFQPPPGVSVALTLRNASGLVMAKTLLEAQDSKGATLSWRMPNLALPEGGRDLSLEVALQDEPKAAGAVQAWTLAALFHGPLPKGELLEVESGDEAMSLPLDASVTGYLHELTDQDRFTFRVPASPEDGPPSILHVRAVSEEANLRLQTEFGQEKEDLDKGKDAEPEILCNLRATPGTWSMLLSASEKQKEELFRIDGVRYKLLVNLHEADHEELEPNQTRFQATPVELDQDYKGFFFPVRDTDTWRFTIEAPASEKKDEAPTRAPASKPSSSPFAAPPLPTAPETVSVKIEVRAPGLNASLEILDEDGASVARRDARGPGEAESLSLDLPPGAYFARVRSTDRRAACEEPYRLKVSTTP